MYFRRRLLARGEGKGLEKSLARLRLIVQELDGLDDGQPRVVGTVGVAAGDKQEGVAAPG